MFGWTRKRRGRRSSTDQIWDTWARDQEWHWRALQALARYRKLEDYDAKLQNYYALNRAMYNLDSEQYNRVTATWTPQQKSL